MQTESKTAILLMHCPDKQGILAVVTDFINKNGGNIVYLDQYVDRTEKIFFMRVEWELNDFIIPDEKIEEYFATLYAQKYDMDFKLYFSTNKRNFAMQEINYPNMSWKEITSQTVSPDFENSKAHRCWLFELS